ncbi:MAG: FHA domain-containing protein [Aphanocapsa sp. GSE-SYN-MK-11-07L]|jgi:ABC-type multidrug transport system ATPase subunit/pSer/pThr/pTyr-binding forkhead associated (FHA) protein|nr:FHA domain-containing protein [Aphanocapsa sp. GSE-SYN-MK-11-07L]
MPGLAAKLTLRQRGQPSQDRLLDQQPLTLGTDASNSLVLVGKGIASHHCQVVWRTDHYEIADLESNTGTWVNDLRLPALAPHALQAGDRIRIGSYHLQFLLSESAPPLPGTEVMEATSAHMLQVSTPTWIQEFPLKQDLLTLGRDRQCEICIDLPMVSYQHARLSRVGNTYKMTDLGSKNGLLFEGSYVSERSLADGDVIKIGEELTLTFIAVPATQVATTMTPLNLRERTLIRLGRDPSNDTVMDHPVVSRFHAKIELLLGNWIIVDLDSSNGTYVNGKAIKEPRRLRPDDTIRIGPYQLVFSVDETLVSQNDAGNLRLDAVHLSKVTDKGITLLDDISLSILPREFVAIVGGSGAGKSTLLDALNGFRPASTGLVFVNANDLYKNFNAYRTEIGYVPQDDIIHQELAVGQALDYAARLRLPPDTSLAERQQQVQSVLADLELTHRQQVRVKSLSGGQRKRVSIGVELLTKPSLFFLDEATSGLDPGTELQMMRLLRRLADQGRTILLITHATKNVMMCNMVVFLAKGGRVAYFGPPDQALTYFGVKDFDEIYLKVERELSPQDWQTRYKQSRQYQQYVVNRQQPLEIDTLAGRQTRSSQSPPPVQGKGVSAWRQFLILSQRNLAILLQDRASLILMLALAPLLGLLDFAMWERQLFDPTTGDAGQAFTMAFVAVLIAVIVGSLATMREIVKEAEIYRRERMVGLKLLPYVFSKISLGAGLAFYQAAIFLLTKLLSVNIPIAGWAIVSLYITLLLATMGGMVMGLMVSALSPTQNVAPLLTILFLVPQITFAGAILPLQSMGWVGQGISQLTISRWAYEAVVTTTGIARDVAADSCWQLSDQARDKLSDSQKQTCQCLGANIFKRCDFPGVRQEYDPAVDQPEPVKPTEPGDPPDIPDNPLAGGFQDDLEAYNDKVKAYSQAIDTWQDKFSTWKQNRETAIASGETLVSRFRDTQGPTFSVNVPLNWGKMGLIMLGMLGILLVVQKRKDII